MTIFSTSSDYHLSSLILLFFPQTTFYRKRNGSLIKWFGKLWVEKLSFFAVGLVRLSCALSSHGRDNVIWDVLQMHLTPKPALWATFSLSKTSCSAIISWETLLLSIQNLITSIFSPLYSMKRNVAFWRKKTYAPVLLSIQLNECAFPSLSARTAGLLMY